MIAPDDGKAAGKGKASRILKAVVSHPEAPPKKYGKQGDRDKCPETRERIAALAVPSPLARVEGGARARSGRALQAEGEKDTGLRRRCASVDPVSTSLVGEATATVNPGKVRRVEGPPCAAAGDRHSHQQEERLEALVKAEDFAGAAALKAEMQKEAEAQVASVRDAAATRDRRRQEQEERLEELVKARDYAGAAAHKAEMQKDAEAQVASSRDVAAALGGEGRRARSGRG